jgi:hypothetical protein
LQGEAGGQGEQAKICPELLCIRQLKYKELRVEWRSTHYDVFTSCSEEVVANDFNHVTRDALMH